MTAAAGEARSGVLSAEFEAHHDGTGKLNVTASANGFSGEGGAHFAEQELIDFGESLRAYPLPEFPLAVAGGFWKTNPGTLELEQELVRIEVYRVEGRGQVGIQVHLAGEQWSQIRPESVPEVRLELLTTYERLDRFATDFVLVVRGERDQATIEEERLA